MQDPNCGSISRHFQASAGAQKAKAFVGSLKQATPTDKFGTSVHFPRRFDKALSDLDSCLDKDLSSAEFSSLGEREMPAYLAS
jgi:hypothetical protein